jgi:hypothetical protein
MKLFHIEIHLNGYVRHGRVIGEELEKTGNTINDYYLKRGIELYFFELNEIKEVSLYEIELVSEKTEQDNSLDTLYFVQFHDLEEKSVHAIYLTAKNEEDVMLQLYKNSEYRVNLNHRHEIHCDELKTIGPYQVNLTKKEAI